MSPLVVPTVVQATDIKIGEHVQREFLGMTFNMDTIWAMSIAGVLVVILGFWARSQLTRDTADHVPTKLQLTWEFVVNEVNNQVADNLLRQSIELNGLEEARHKQVLARLVRAYSIRLTPEPERR